MEQKSYRTALEKCVRKAHENHNFITEEQYRECFRELSMNPTEDSLTRGYLENIHIRFGTWEPEKEEETVLNDKDGTYLRFYLEELSELPVLTKEELLDVTKKAMEDDKEAKARLLNAHLSDVVEIAKLYVYQNLPIEDLIGEGNIALMTGIETLSCIEDASEADGYLGKMIMDAMDAAIAGDTDDRERMDGVLSRLSDLAEKASSVSKEYRRAVTAEELSAEGGFTIEEILEALRLTGNQIEGLIPPDRE